MSDKKTIEAKALKGRFEVIGEFFNIGAVHYNKGAFLPHKSPNTAIVTAIKNKQLKDHQPTK